MKQHDEIRWQRFTDIGYRVASWLGAAILAGLLGALIFGGLK